MNNENTKSMQKKTVLITGASGGIGAEFARLFAADGSDLLLVARREEKLAALKAELEAAYHIKVAIHAQDLTQTGAAEALFEYSTAHGIEVDVLVNNAGFGDWGFFAESDVRKQQAMIQLNVATLTTLTHLFLPQMIARGNGHILNVASIASFMPGAKMAVYYASKAFVRSFSEALSVELKKTNSGVTVTALCPGPVKTDFWDTAEAGKSSLFKHFFFADAKSVARCGYKAIKKGKVLALPGFAIWISAVITKVFSRSFVRNAVYWIQK
ncbi:MAG: SDR family oxidoreductase [Treponema sp.]|nr:SDR family oxidoreductase [Treponema sp.]